MKTLKFLLGISVLMSLLLVISSLKILKIQEGPHGGSVKMAGNYHIEMKSTGNIFHAYLLDKKMEPMKNEFTSCSVRFFYQDSTMMELELQRYGEDGFSSAKSVPYFETCKITFSVFGKNISAGFANTPYFVKGKK